MISEDNHTKFIWKKLLFGSFFFLVLGCQPKGPAPIKLTGRAQGTTFSITYFGSMDLTSQVDSILQAIDQSMSNYRRGSLIDAFNSSDSGAWIDADFAKVFQESKRVYELTDGLFDPSIYPLVKAWGFGPASKDQIDTLMLDSMRTLVGLDRMQLDHAVADSLWLAKDLGQSLDFNGIAQGYTVDVLCQLLDRYGISQYLVELGGELRAKGKKPGNLPWKVGVDRPLPGERKGLFGTVALAGRSLATSGNYRKFYESNGTYLSHTIDAKSGRPVQSGLVSVTVMARDCMFADAMATSFMIMGKEEVLIFLADHPELDLEVLLMWKEGDEVQFEMTPGMDAVFQAS